MDGSQPALDTLWELIVVGAGAAGMLGAAVAAEHGRRTLLLEKNKHVGVKILMSGGTRCNLTHATDKRGIVREYAEQGAFLHSALAALSPDDLVKLIEAEGVPTKIEEHGKIFPVSNQASDIVDALSRRLERSGAELALNEPVLGIARDGEHFALRTPRGTRRAQRVMITTGGKSYPGCGTSGDAYAWLAELGHTIVTPRPALTPITTHDQRVLDLQGVTIPDVVVRVTPGDGHADALIGSTPPRDRRLHGKRNATDLASRRGAVLFTHFGLSGPAILDVSREISGHPEPAHLRLVLDFLPDEKIEALEDALRAACVADGKRQAINILPTQLPRRLNETLLAVSGVDPARRAAEISKGERRRLAEAIKQWSIVVSGTMGFRKAEVTAGGVALDEVDSRTMESKIVPRLYLAGEVLDLDGPIGGYNFQAAFSTGALAGQSCAIT